MNATQFCCRSCGSNDHETILDLGLQPLANNLLRPEDLSKPEPFLPLVLVVCRSCQLIQIRDLVPPMELFSDYAYFSSYSLSWLKHAEEAAVRYAKDLKLGPDSFVVEIASNDGYLLKHFVEWRIPCLGIEPAANVASVAQSQGIPTLVDFFNLELARKLVKGGQRADLILGNNVLAHVPYINSFLAGAALLLQSAGQIIFECPYALDFLAKTEFDTIYHEHVFYFTLTSLLPLFARHGLELFHVERLSMHGGSLRLFIRHRADGNSSRNASVDELLKLEMIEGVAEGLVYRDFSQRVQQLKTEMLALINDLRGQGKSIAAYGASAKGTILLNMYGLNATVISFVADLSIHKRGKLTPGTHIPIVAPEMLLQAQPDYALLLTWNFADEIVQQQAEYCRRGGKFIVPIPRARFLPQ
jgi:hypothetical protein